MLRKLFHKKPTSSEAVIAAMRELSVAVIRMNIPAIKDDRDVGYDMAVDEVLALIDEAINKAASSDVDYSGGL